MAVTADCGKVVLIPFEVELYVPADEATIEARSLEQWWMSKSALSASIQNEWSKDNIFGYSEGNVRAMIVFSGDIFFVDRYGKVRNGFIYSTLDIKKFRSYLSADPCNTQSGS